MRFRFKYFLYALMALYIIFLGISVMQIRTLMNYSREYLSATRDESRDIRSRVNEFQNIIPALLSSPELDYAGVEAELTRMENSRDLALASIKNSYRGDPATVTSLIEAFKTMRAEIRKLAARMERSSSFEVATRNFNQEIIPYIRPILGYLNEIDVTSQQMEKNVYASIVNKMNLVLFVSVILGAIILTMQILSDKHAQAKNREIAYREGLFNRLSQNIDEVFIVAVNAMEFVYVSPNSQTLLQLDSTDIQKNPQILYDRLDNPNVAKWLENTLNDKLVAQESHDEMVEIPLLQKSFKIHIYPITMVSGNNESYIVSLSDETETMRQQEALSTALEAAHAASAAKSSFLSHMSHEIRTPMNAIIGMTTIAISRLDDKGRVLDCLNKIAESSRHLLGLINDVLDMSKIESGKLSINHEDFNLNKSIANINNIVQPQARQRQLQFEILLEGVEDEDLVGDSLRLNQVLLNLLSNAYKFTPPGGVITLKIQQLQKGKNTVRFRFIIKDTGIGMSEEYLARLYAPFEQASASTASKYGGTGLGMPITANIISLMGGSISVKSKEGVGTEFTVELPFGISDKSTNRGYNLPLLKILIVDDDIGTCEHAALLLDKMGLKTRWTTSALQAVELAKEAHDAGAGFDVCLIDWKMPEMEGHETARRIRSVVGDDVLIIIISAYDWTSIEAEARKAGVNDFIAKPFFSSTLYEALLSATRHLDAPQLQDRMAPKKEYDFHGKRVLLVEDNEFNREIGQEFLEMAHAEVDNAENGQEAVDKVLNSPPGYYDLVLMDVQMPVMDGYEATRTIRASSHPEAGSLVILAMTANAFSEDVAKAVAAGMNGHVAKPIDVNELYRLLEVHLRGHRKQ